MCVAAIINQPVSLAYLKEMEDSNPHGGGVAWPDYAAGVMRFRKGLDHRQIHAMQETGELAYPYLLHFRWATEGDKVPQMTHPFPVGVRALFGELEGAADRVLIHNGTMSWAQQKYWVPDTDYMYHIPWELINRASDTAIAAWLMTEPGSEDILKALKWATCVGSVRDGKLVTELEGDWENFEGNQYSNLHWLPYSARGRGGSYFPAAWDWEGAGAEWEGGHAWGARQAGSRGYGEGRVIPSVRKRGTSTGEYPSTREWENFQAIAVKILGPEPVDYDAPDWGPRYVTWFEGKRDLRAMEPAELHELLAAAENARESEDDDEVTKEIPVSVSQKHFGSFEEYCRVKYGDECATELNSDTPDSGYEEAEYMGLTVRDTPDAELVSDDPAEVNSWLARQMIG